MDKNGKLFNGLIILLCVLIFIGAALALYFITHLDRREVVHVVIDGEAGETVSFTDLALLPGEETSYMLSVHGEVSGTSDLVLAFRRDSDIEDDRLAEYLMVRITLGEEVLAEALVGELLDGDALVLEKILDPSEQIDLVVTYYLPHEVGNEVQGAEISFFLILSADNIKYD